MNDFSLLYATDKVGERNNLSKKLGTGELFLKSSFEVLLTMRRNSSALSCRKQLASKENCCARMRLHIAPTYRSCPITYLVSSAQHGSKCIWNDR